MKEAMNINNAEVRGSSASIDNPLTELLRSGARALIQQAVESELQAFLGNYANVADIRGRQTIMRNGYLPEREILTSIGDVAFKIPKVRDRSGGGVKFNSSLVPPYVRKARRVEAALPWLY